MKNGQEKCVCDSVLGSMLDKMLNYPIQQLMFEGDTSINQFLGHQVKLLIFMFPKALDTNKVKRLWGC